MATYHLRKFSDPDALKTITPKCLLELLTPFKEFFTGRDVVLPTAATKDNLPYEGIVKVFMTPSADTPGALLEALFWIHEMATDEGADELLKELQSRKVSLDDNPDPTPADLAVRTWLFSKDLLERKHAEQFVRRPRSFEYYQADNWPIPAFRPSDKKLEGMSEDLDDWFDNKKRGRGTKVFLFEKDDAMYFLVRHGELFTRKGRTDGPYASVFFRPEKHDLIVYEPNTGCLRMNAASKGEKDIYRRLFGRHLFGEDEFFKGASRHTLDPLKRDGSNSLVCADVAGIERVTLKKIQYFWGGPQHDKETRESDDVFASLEAKGRRIPENARIIYAAFAVKFTDSKTPRMIEIRPSKSGDRAAFTRDEDAGPIINDFLKKRGFFTNNSGSDNEEDREEVGAAVESV
jgi:hypothetical protein